MDLKGFKASLAEAQPPRRLNSALQALWWEAKGDWDKAHDCAQAADDRNAAWVHAYLHRKVGDLSNAAYWYRRAGRSPAEEPLPQEWAAIAEALLGP